MVRQLILPLIASVFPLASGVLAQQVATPQPVAPATAATAPYLYNGLLWADYAYGSASLVAPGVVATAAHIVFDDVAMEWLPISQVRYYPRYNQGRDPLTTSATYFIPAGIQRWTSYYPERVAKDDEPGFSSLDTFNVDFAAAWFTATDPLLATHAEAHVDADGATGILRDSRDKLLVGYPSEQPQIPLSDSGRMHATAPADYYCEWEGIEGISERDQEFPGGLWYANYTLYDITTYAGGSGGPMYVRDDLGRWLMAGVLVGSSGTDSALVRAIDDNAWEFIEEAEFLRGTSTLRRVDNLEVAASGSTSVSLEWSDHSQGEAGYTVLRQNTGTWEAIATLPADAVAYQDTAALPGHIYHYQVQPFAANGNRPPRSAAVAASTRGNNPRATSILAQPWLQFSNDGDSNWHTDAGNRLRSGKVRHNGWSSLRLDILGPGRLRFQWSVSSEDNPDYANPDSPNQGEIYDALHLYINGSPYIENGKPVFISGLGKSQTRELPLPAGAWRVEWRYSKDPYTTAGDDAGYLDSLTWTPDAAAPYPVFGGYQFGDPAWHGSEWFGVYHAAAWPWVAHYELGWMYFQGTADGRLYGYSTLPLIGRFYTTPAFYPYLYLPGSATWLYYVRGTGLWGSGAWFWNFNTGSWVQTP